MRYPNNDNVGINGTNTSSNPAAGATGANGQNMKIINNIMHINHSGANINIMCGSSTDKQNNLGQNNFIFNHTAPINLNFYEEVNKNKLAAGGAKPDSLKA